MSRPPLRVIAHGLPVVAALGAGAHLHPFADSLLDDVRAIGELACGLIETAENILKKRFFGVDEFSGLPIELPEDSGFADGESGLQIADIDQDALVDFVEIERFVGHVLEIPGERAVVGMQSER